MTPVVTVKKTVLPKAFQKLGSPTMRTKLSRPLKCRLRATPRQCMKLTPKARA